MNPRKAKDRMEPGIDRLVEQIQSSMQLRLHLTLALTYSLSFLSIGLHLSLSHRRLSLTYNTKQHTFKYCMYVVYIAQIGKSPDIMGVRGGGGLD